MIRSPVNNMMIVLLSSLATLLVSNLPLIGAQTAGSIVNNLSGMCQTAAGYKTRNPGAVFQLPCAASKFGRPSQQWTFKLAGTNSNAYQIVSGLADAPERLCLGVLNGVLKDGAPIVQRPCDSNDLAQQFRVNMLGPNEYQLIPTKSLDKCIQLKRGGATTTNNNNNYMLGRFVRMEQHPCDPAEPSQKWDIGAEIPTPPPPPRAARENELRLISKVTRTCLEIDFSDLTGSSKAVLSECDGGDTQTFSFEKAPQGSRIPYNNIVATFTRALAVEQCFSVRLNLGTGKDQTLIQSPCLPNQFLQQWETIPIVTQGGSEDNNFSLIRNRLLNKCMTVDTRGVTGGMIMAECDRTSDAQLWITVLSQEAPLDLVFFIDESGSQQAIQQTIRDNIPMMFGSLANATSAFFRAGIVGFGANQNRGNPVVRQVLTNNIEDFTGAALRLVTDGGYEPGLNAIIDAAANNVNGKKLGVGNSFPGANGFCAVLFTDEDSDGSNEVVRKRAKAALNGSPFFAVVDTSAGSTRDDYVNALATKTYNINAFSSQLASTMVQDMIASCVEITCSPEITSFSVANKGGRTAGPLPSTLSQAEYPSIREIVAMVSTCGIKSVLIDYDGVTRCDRAAPYTFVVGAGFDFTTGSHVVKATPYAGVRCNGAAGKPLQKRFTITK